MNKLTKALLAAAVAAGAILTAPVAANAATYPPDPPTVTGGAAGTVSGSTAPGGSFTVAFGPIFIANHDLTVYFFSTGAVPTALGVFHAAESPALAASTDPAGAASVSATMPADASAPVTVEASDGTTVAAITVPVAAAGAAAGSGAEPATGGALPTTGSYVSLAVVWGAVGLLVLGAAFLVMRRVTHRPRSETGPAADRT